MSAEHSLSTIQYPETVLQPVYSITDTLPYHEPTHGGEGDNKENVLANIQEADAIFIISRGLMRDDEGNVHPAEPYARYHFPAQPGLNGGERIRTIRELIDQGIIYHNTLLITTSGDSGNSDYPGSYADTHMKTLIGGKDPVEMPPLFEQLWTGTDRDGDRNISRETLAEMAAMLQLIENQKLNRVTVFTDDVQGLRLIIMLGAYGFTGEQPHRIGIEMAQKATDMINSNPLIARLHEHGMEELLQQAEQRQKNENVPIEKRKGQLNMIQKAYDFINNLNFYLPLLNDPQYMKLVAERLFDNIAAKSHVDYRTMAGPDLLNNISPEASIDIVSMHDVQRAMGQYKMLDMAQLEALCWDLAGMKDILDGMYYQQPGQAPLWQLQNQQT